jgi:hypothetical protein
MSEIMAPDQDSEHWRSEFPPAPPTDASGPVLAPVPESRSSAVVNRSRLRVAALVIAATGLTSALLWQDRAKPLPDASPAAQDAAVVQAPAPVPSPRPASAPPPRAIDIPARTAGEMQASRGDSETLVPYQPPSAKDPAPQPAVRTVPQYPAGAPAAEKPAPKAASGTDAEAPALIKVTVAGPQASPQTASPAQSNPLTQALFPPLAQIWRRGRAPAGPRVPPQAPPAAGAAPELRSLCGTFASTPLPQDSAVPSGWTGTEDSIRLIGVCQGLYIHGHLMESDHRRGFLNPHGKPMYYVYEFVNHQDHPVRYVADDVGHAWSVDVAPLKRVMLRWVRLSKAP